MRIVTVLVLILLALTLSNAQETLPVIENFSYSTGNLVTVSSSRWTNGGGTDFVVGASNLTYSGYAPNNTSTSSVSIVNSNDQEAYIPFTNTSSGTMYLSFLISITSAPTTGNYVIFLVDSPTGSHTVGVSVWVRDNGSGQFNIGVGKNVSSVSFTPGWGSGNYTSGSTHLVVAKHVFQGGVNEDSVYLYVDPTLPGNEPSSPTAYHFDNAASDPSGLNAIAMIETATNGIAATIDAIRVGTTWSDAPLPVQMTEFLALANRLDVNLTWSTATETNNYGFEIERRTVGGTNQSWQPVGFVQGSGTTTEPRTYAYVDKGLFAGRYAYRVKQVDLGGSFTYFTSAEVEVGATDKELALEPNFPNPFNPSTKISFSVPENGRAILRVYNMLGQEVAVLFDGEAEAGRLYQQTFDASSLPSGVYISRLEYAGQSVIRKMLFMK